MRKDLARRIELYDGHIIDGYRLGKSVEQLAMELGITKQKVKYIAYKNGITKQWKHTVESFTEAAKIIHGEDTYDYSKVVYVGNKIKVIIICPKHGEFLQTPHMHISKKQQGCPVCSISSIHRSIMRVLDDLEVAYEVNNRTVLKGKELDIYLPLYKLAIELNGEFYHTVDKVGRTYHYKKFKDCEDLGIRLLQFWGKEVTNKKALVTSMIKNALGVVTKKIYARNCNVNTNVTSNVYREFLRLHHLEGEKNSSIRLGLHYDGKLVAVMGFSRVNEGYELDRFCSEKDAVVVGGFSKMLNYRPPGRIISYSFNRYSNGNVYAKNGFAFSRENPASLFYYHGGQLKNRNSFMKYKLRKKLGIDEDDLRTERELAESIGAFQVFDAGTRTWVMD